MGIHDNIRKLWKEAIARGENPPPLNEILSRFPDERIPLTEKEMEQGKRIAERIAEAIRNKVY